MAKRLQKEKGSGVATLRAFKIIMDNGEVLPCDADELPKILLAIDINRTVIIRSGVFNPNTYSLITEDRARALPVGDIFEGIDLGVGAHARQQIFKKGQAKQTTSQVDEDEEPAPPPVVVDPVWKKAGFRPKPYFGDKVIRQ